MVNASTTQRRGPPPLPDAKAAEANREITGVREKEATHELSPELRREVQSIVRSTIDRAIAPLYDKQKKLEQALDHARAELEVERAKLVIAARPLPAIPLPSAPVAAAARMQAPTLDDAESIRVFVEEEPAPAPPMETSDVPWELDGSRRRRLLAWIFGALVVLALGAAAAAAMLSQAGYKI
jgi:hypothetical protein